jgi:hypothetical protein
MRLQLVDDGQRERQPVQPARVGRPHLQRPRPDLGLPRVGAPPQHEVAVHDVLVEQLAREALRVAEQVLGLLARGRDDDDARVLDRHEVVQRDQRHQRRLAVAARQQDHDLALAAGDGVRRWNGSSASPHSSANASIELARGLSTIPTAMVRYFM